MPLDSPVDPKALRHDPGSPRLEARLKRALKGEVLFDRFSRGRYSTDASIYQIEPLGVALPKDREDVAAALTIAREEGVPVLPRGGGTSQCGQTVARALVLDCSKFMDGVIAVDVENRRVRVQPGVVMERLNARLRQHKLWFPVDVSTGDRATIGGMTANNSCGARSIRYGNMVHNVRAIDAVLADGTEARFAEVPGNFAEDVQPERYRGLVRDMRPLHRREADEIEARFPKLLRRVGGYNIDMISGDGSHGGHNMAHLLVGSEGTLGFFTEIELDLQPIPPHRVLGICHFPTFYQAMDATQHIVKLGPSACELVDCAVRLEDLAEYTDRLTQVFHKHGTYGTWYAHASVGCLHVRPVLNVKQELDVKKMRAIAEEAFAMVREYKGSHSGEHGDGLVRSEHHEAMFGPRIVRAFEEVKDSFDPAGLFNPGKIVRPSKMDDRSLFRFKPGYRQVPLDTVLDWSEWGGFASAAEMCNNNGACRKSDPGVMCPSYRATGDEQHLTRGRANTLRLALSGHLGPAALISDEMRETMALCVSCKGCKRECPTGVDMAKMKIEFLHHYKKRHGLSARDRAIAYLPRYAPYAAPFAPLLNLRNRVPALAALGEKMLGLSARRSLPEWLSRPYPGATNNGAGVPNEVVLLVEEFVASERAAGRFELKLAPMPGRTALLHGHCHQKAFNTAGAAAEALRLIPELQVETFDSTCCGMAGSFGLEAEHYHVSLKIGELGVLPKMRAAAPETLLAACGTSCRHQIADAAGRDARHIVRILDEASAN